MATVSDFGSLEAKRLRVEEEISAVRYGTEIMDKDLIFKVGDISNPNQSIRFSVHDGEGYRDAFSVDSNGFAVSDLRMSGPASGVTGIDELVKLGEMRVQHFNDHSNQRAGEIIFSVNIGDTDTHNMDVMSLTPEEASITTPVTVHGDLSCASSFSNTLVVRGNEFRNVVASFSHPLAPDALTIERDDDGMLLLHGDIKSSEANIHSLSASAIATSILDTGFCSVGSLHMAGWQLSGCGVDLCVQGPGKFRLPGEAEVELLNCSSLESSEMRCERLSVSALTSEQLISANVSVGQIVLSEISCPDALSLPLTSTITFRNDATITVQNDGLQVSDSVLSKRLLVAGGLSCSDGDLSLHSTDVASLTAERASVATLSCSSLLGDHVSVASANAHSFEAVSVLSQALSCPGLQVDAERVHLAVDDEMLLITSDGVQSNRLKSRLLVCNDLSTGSLSSEDVSVQTLSVLSVSAHSVLTEDLSASSVNSNQLVTREIKCADVRIAQSHDSLEVSHKILTPAVSTSSLYVSSRLSFSTDSGEEGTTLVCDSAGLIINTPVSCQELTFPSAVTSYVSCASIHGLELINTPRLHARTDHFSVGEENMMAFDTGNLEISGTETRLRLRPDNGQHLELGVGHLITSGEMTISCQRLLLPETKTESMETGSLTTDTIYPTSGGALHLHAGVVCDAISTASVRAGTLSAGQIQADVLTTSSLLTSELKSEGGTGLVLTTDATLFAENLILNSSRSDTELVLSNPVSEFRLRSGSNVSIHSNPIFMHTSLSCSDLSTPRITTNLISSSEPVLKCNSSLEIDGACSVSDALYVPRLSCAHTSVDRISGLQVIESSELAFTDNGVEILRATGRGVTVGAFDSDVLHNARLAIRSFPFSDGLKVTSNDMSTIRLETSQKQRRGIVLASTSGRSDLSSDEWLAGVGNFPSEKEDTFGFYYNESPFFSLEPVADRIVSYKSVFVPMLSVHAAHLEASLQMQDCLLTPSGGDLNLDCLVLSVGAQVVLANGADMKLTRITSLADPVNDRDAASKVYVESRLTDFFTEDRAFFAPVFWAPFDQPDMQSFGIGLSFLNPSNASSTTLSYEILTGRTRQQSFRFVSSVDDSPQAQMELLHDEIKFYLPIEVQGQISLPFHTIESTSDSLNLSGTVKISDVLGIGVTPLHPLHVISSSDDDVAVLQAASERARVNVDATGASARQAMVTCKVDATGFSTGYEKESDSFVIASSTDLVQNTHLIISRQSSKVVTAGDVNVVKDGGSFSITEDGNDTFFADKTKINFKNFGIAFEDLSVRHRVGGLTLLELNSSGCEITGDLKIGSVLFSESEFGDLTVDTKMAIPDVETTTLSVDDKIGFNVYEDDAVRFRDEGSGMLMNFDSSTEMLNFSFPVLPNANGRGELFAANTAILSLRKDAVCIDSLLTPAKLNVSSESMQLSLLNPANMKADFHVDDSGELNISTTARKYNLDGDVTTDNISSNNYVYIGDTHRWRLGVTDEGGLVIQHRQNEEWVTKTAIDP